MKKMREQNPFNATFDHLRDVELVEAAVEGKKEALTELVQRHNPFIYNIALKMLGSPVDAQDVTQDILIKLITSLTSYDHKRAQFRTWLYRIAANTIINYKKSATEKQIVSFDQFFGFIDEIPNDEFEEDIPIAWSEESKIKCMTGMLMCVPRQDRLLYIIGDLFGVDHILGSEIFEISPANFRKKLSRIRHHLRQWMHNRCGLVNKDNPCRCARKTKGFIERGIVDPDNLLWNQQFASRISDYTEQNVQDALRSSDKIYSSLYQKHPIKKNIAASEIIDSIFSDGTLREILEL
ncbi:MAG: RNA polymerase sigma factor [Bacteroidota bacterium]